MGSRHVSPNTGNLGSFCPFGGAGFGGGDDGDIRVDWAARNVVLGPFEGPARDFPFDDAGVGAPTPWGQQALQQFSERGFERADESAGGKMPPGR
jgi:hypothetical protein